ncbi:hypothetical protein ACPYOC_09875 [Ornithinimicrobium sp. W1665]|uniref:hypothetical protein n=1 Tax=Ornithinimicrobium sp. W1665 TaxID=3416666 RepID=UPI003CE6D048
MEASPSDVEPPAGPSEQPSFVVPLHALGTDVDLHVTGHAAPELAAQLRDRWHLALRPAAADAAPDAAADATDAAPDVTPDAASGPAPETVVVRAHRLAPEETPPPWTRGARTVADSDPRRLLQHLTQAVTHAVITARTGDLLMLHAAALADPVTGATAVFVAPGNTGKTTLCRTLGPTRTYVSDETVGIRRDGGVTPYLKPLSTRRPDWAGVKDEQAPGQVGLRAPVAEPWVAGIVVLRRDAEHAGPVELEPLDTLDAVVALTPESSGFMRTDGPLRWLADVLERTGGARRATYAEVSGLEPLAAEICARRSPW